jgi:hypothetical protein
LSVSEWHKQFKITNKEQIKKMLITTFHIMGIVHFEFIPKVKAVNQAYYVEMSKQLHEVVHRERPELWPNRFPTLTMLQLTRYSLSSTL